MLWDWLVAAGWDITQGARGGKYDYVKEIVVVYTLTLKLRVRGRIMDRLP